MTSSASSTCPWTFDTDSSSSLSVGEGCVEAEYRELEDPDARYVETGRSKDSDWVRVRGEFREGGDREGEEVWDVLRSGRYRDSPEVSASMIVDKSPGRISMIWPCSTQRKHIRLSCSMISFSSRGYDTDRRKGVLEPDSPATSADASIIEEGSGPMAITSSNVSSTGLTFVGGRKNEPEGRLPSSPLPLSFVIDRLTVPNVVNDLPAFPCVCDTDRL